MRVITICLAAIFVAGTAFATDVQSPEPAVEAAAESAPTEAPAAAGGPVEAPAEPMAAAEETAPPVVVIARAAFTTGVVEREPVDTIESLTNDHERVFFFSEIQGTPGQVITHRWEYKDEVMGEVSFETGGTRWRVHSSKRLLPDWMGDWTVVLLDGSSNELGRYKLEVVQAPPAVGKLPATKPDAAPAAPMEEVEVPSPSTPAPEDGAPPEGAHP